MLFTLLFALSFYATWVALRGVYMAHHERLVWGGRLMS
jgi:hypothetical protein